MLSSTFTFKNSQGINVHVFKWFPESKPKAIVQISHGMVETAERYARFAEALVNAGYGVYANDHVAHGRTAKSVTDIGVIGKNGFIEMTDTVHELTEIIKKENPSTKVILFGHSMGSFISQKYIQDYGKDISGVILTGTAGPTAGVGVVKLLASIQMAVKGVDSKGHFLTKLQFGGFNKKFAPNRTEFDWLSSEDAEVDKYIKSEYCGAVTTAGFVYTICDGLTKLHSDSVMNKVPKELPMYIFVGEKDPVGGETKTVTWLINKYKALGIKDVSHKFYSGARHELLNEKCKDEVAKDVIIWLNDHI
jgi:alpha-beta hydrolase superfamily lysophospholipase